MYEHRSWRFQGEDFNGLMVLSCLSRGLTTRLGPPDHPTETLRDLGKRLRIGWLIA